MKPTVSIVIPAYNEADSLRGCLEAIAAQTVAPAEVIVVDNNSTDRTVEIALSYPFVRVLRERRQGVVFARDAGFSAARGEIIGRIDADTRPAPDWVATLQRIFVEPRPAGPDAVSGSARYHDLPLKPLFGALDHGTRRQVARRLPDTVFLFGANMAIRAAAWRDVREQVCRDGALHEDYDLAIHLARLGPGRVRYEPALRAWVSARRVDTRFSSYYTYVLTVPRTYAAHGLRGQYHLYPAAALLLAMYVPTRLLYRGHRPQGGFSLAQVLDRRRQHRPSPLSASSGDTRPRRRRVPAIPHQEPVHDPFPIPVPALPGNHIRPRAEHEHPTAADRSDLAPTSARRFPFGTEGRCAGSARAEEVEDGRGRGVGAPRR